MLNQIKIWFHHLLNPHCVECKADRHDEIIFKRDQVIDEYRELLASARLEIGRLTQALVDLSKPPEVVERVIKTDFQPLPRKMRMNELAQKLTRESAEEAHRLRTNKVNESNSLRDNDLKEEVQKLESEIGVN